METANIQTKGGFSKRCKRRGNIQPMVVLRDQIMGREIIQSKQKPGVCE
jgi:hypothetical protein